MIIGIAGHARHGKDSIADVLVKRYGYRKHALADVMKEACRVIFGWTDAHLYGDLKDKIDPNYGISPRHALQTLGTEWGQYKLSEYDSFAEVTGRKLWVNSLLSRVSGGTVISDVRFLHEAQAIKEKGGIIILVRRFDKDKEYPWDKNHASELSVEEITPDYLIENNQGLKELEEKVIYAMENIKNISVVKNSFT